MAVLTDGLERAFARFGGVPKELLFDQMRAVELSDQREGMRQAGVERGVTALCRALGIPPARVPPVSGSRRRASSRRPIRYIRDSFFYGRAFANDEDLNEQASRWLQGTAPTCVGTVRRASAQWIDSSGTSVRC